MTDSDAVQTHALERPAEIELTGCTTPGQAAARLRDRISRGRFVRVRNDPPPRNFWPAIGWLVIVGAQTAALAAIALAWPAPAATAPAATAAAAIAAAAIAATAATAATADAPAAGWHCVPPPSDGDRVVIVIMNRGGQLVATCRTLADWRNPMRGLTHE